MENMMEKRNCIDKTKVNKGFSHGWERERNHYKTWKIKIFLNEKDKIVV